VLVHTHTHTHTHARAHTHTHTICDVCVFACAGALIAEKTLVRLHLATAWMLLPDVNPVFYSIL